jgi:hypothetical protein
LENVLTRRIRALEFADALARQINATPWRQVLRAADESAEHKALASYIDEYLVQFLQQHDSNPQERLFDWEGNSARTWAQSHSYELLGTWAHPDAAVLRPFSCALEFDRQPPTKGASYLKERLMKAACHVLSGAYDASLFVYILNRTGETGKAYLESHPFTKQLLDSLRAHGLVVALVEPA